MAHATAALTPCARLKLADRRNDVPVAQATARLQVVWPTATSRVGLIPVTAEETSATAAETGLAQTHSQTGPRKAVAHRT